MYIIFILYLYYIYRVLQYNMCSLQIPTNVCVWYVLGCVGVPVLYSHGCLCVLFWFFLFLSVGADFIRLIASRSI